MILQKRHALVTLFCYINMSPNTTCLPAGTLASGAKLPTTSYLFGPEFVMRAPFVRGFLGFVGRCPYRCGVYCASGCRASRTQAV